MARAFPPPDKQWRVTELKKLKLIAKAGRESHLRHARAATPVWFGSRTRPMSPPRDLPGFRGLSHLTSAGEARMVDVSAKAETVREAAARGTLKMKAATLAAGRAGQLANGDVLGVARTAVITSATRTPDLIPPCRPLRIH